MCAADFAVTHTQDNGERGYKKERDMEARRRKRSKDGIFLEWCRY